MRSFRSRSRASYPFGTANLVSGITGFLVIGRYPTDISGRGMIGGDRSLDRVHYDGGAAVIEGFDIRGIVVAGVQDRVGAEDRSVAKQFVKGCTLCCTLVLADSVALDGRLGCY